MCGGGPSRILRHNTIRNIIAKACRIDVAVINPLCSANIDDLVSEGDGGAATAYGRRKEHIYRDIDFMSTNSSPL